MACDLFARPQWLRRRRHAGSAVRASAPPRIGRVGARTGAPYRARPSAELRQAFGDEIAAITGGCAATGLRRAAPPDEASRRLPEPCRCGTAGASARAAGGRAGRGGGLSPSPARHLRRRWAPGHPACSGACSRRRESRPSQTGRCVHARHAVPPPPRPLAGAGLPDLAAGLVGWPGDTAALAPTRPAGCSGRAALVRRTAPGARRPAPQAARRSVR